MNGAFLSLDGNALNDNVVIKRADELKIWRRGEKMIVLCPKNGGSLLLDKFGQDLFKRLSRDQKLGSLLNGNDSEKTSILRTIANMYSAGIVQILGKDLHFSSISHSSIVRIEIPRLDEDLQNLPSCVCESLKAWNTDKTDRTCEQGTLADFFKKNKAPIILETTVLSEHMLESFVKIWSVCSKNACVEKIVVHCYIDDSMSKAWEKLIVDKLFDCTKLELLCYCPSESLNKYKRDIGRLLKLQIPCLPVGCISEPRQIRSWIRDTIAWRYRSAGFTMRSLLEKEVWDNRDVLNALFEELCLVCDYINTYFIEHKVRLRVHPLEKWLVCLGNGNNYAWPVQRLELTCLDFEGDIKISSWSPATMPSLCERCFARSYCSRLDMSQMTSSSCWLKKRIFEELLWRLWSEHTALNDIFQKRLAL